MTDETETFDRRSYLKLTGVTGIAATGFAGCLEDAGNGNDEGDQSDGASGENEIIAGTAPGFQPFEMNRDGELVGFDIDHLEAVVDETDYELTGWEEFEFDTLIQALNNGNIDVIAAAMTINDERREQIAFTDPYYSANQSVLVQTGGGFQPSDLDDLAGRTLGAQSGTTGEGIIEDEVEDPDYQSYENYVYAVQELEQGRIEAIVIDQPVAESFEADREVEIAFTFETGEEYGLGVRQDDDDLREALNEGIAAVQESGEYEEITQEWFGE
ncbi:basic amino acid ABC transporter substrate-binding protein [Haloterrigena alkaliphila]|uniref:Basic amino acid ABC transporter substrate-binding protein n=1 Tax=Haloterrigena alkaliphila TaxID=2816475 RepID=A0A8A2VK71_9EURY|nr:basic amino acid ABC transporter substrate-binding protein [Haloterrigena alkaliphila]QSX00723.1 basic amino acid ABC transporter substrate-binding protein [Haloterrigena alkaliphila]